LVYLTCMSSSAVIAGHENSLFTWRTTASCRPLVLSVRGVPAQATPDKLQTDGTLPWIIASSSDDPIIINYISVNRYAFGACMGLNMFGAPGRRTSDGYTPIYGPLFSAGGHQGRKLQLLDCAQRGIGCCEQLRVASLLFGLDRPLRRVALHQPDTELELSPVVHINSRAGRQVARARTSDSDDSILHTKSTTTAKTLSYIRRSHAPEVQVSVLRPVTRARVE
jgi:hypothetical protein